MKEYILKINNNEEEIFKAESVESAIGYAEYKFSQSRNGFYSCGFRLYDAETYKMIYQSAYTAITSGAKPTI